MGKPRDIIRIVVELTSLHNQSIEFAYYDRLVGHGILRKEESKRIGLFSKRNYYLEQPNIREQILARLFAIISEKSPAELRTLYLLGLVWNTDLPLHLFSDQQNKILASKDSTIFSPLLEQHQSNPTVDFYLRVVTAVKAARQPYTGQIAEKKQEAICFTRRGCPT